MSRCKSCMAPIVWARTETGKRVPLDAKPTEAGNIVLSDGIAHVVNRQAGLFDDPTGEYHLSHFATCPNANDHRSPRKDRT